MSLRNVLTFAFVLLLGFFAAVTLFAVHVSIEKVLLTDAKRELEIFSEEWRVRSESLIEEQQAAVRGLAQSMELNCGLTGVVDRECARNLLAGFQKEHHPLGLAFRSHRRSWRTFGAIAPEGMADGLTVGEGRLSYRYQSTETGLVMAAVFSTEELIAAASGSRMDGALSYFEAGAPLGHEHHQKVGPAAFSSRLCERLPASPQEENGFVGFAAVNRFGICRATVLPVNEVVKPAASLRRRLLVFSGIFILISIALAVLLARLIAAPIHRLALSVGKKDIPASAWQPAEVRVLTSAFQKANQRLATASKNLKDSMSRLQATYESARVWPWEQQEKDGPIRWISMRDGNEEVSTESQPELLARVHPDDRESLLRGLHDSWEGKAFSVQFRLIAPSGHLWLISRGSLVEHRNEPSKLLGVNVDVSERFALSEAMLEKERLAGAVRMAASLAHEVNNPLAAVMNASYLLEEHADERSKQVASLLHKEVQRIAHIVKQLLGLHTVERDVSEVELEALIAAVAEELQPQAWQKYIRLERVTAPLLIQANGGELRQALRNTVLNAIQHSAGCTRIRIQARRHHGLPDSVCITVADNGAGIPSGELSVITEPFYSAPGLKGRGLGLWVTKALVEKHNGRLRLKSWKSSFRGTIVSITLPIDQAQVKTEQVA